MSTYIILYPNALTSQGSKINNPITCNSLTMLTSELLKITTCDDLKNINVIKMDGHNSSVFKFDKDGLLTSGHDFICIPEMRTKFNQIKKQEQTYLLVDNYSCQMYNYDDLKATLHRLNVIDWKIITYPDCILYSYDKDVNLFVDSENKHLPEELTEHLIGEYKMVMHFYTDLFFPLQTHTKEMCQSRFVPKGTILTDKMCSYLTHLALNKKIKYEVSEYKNLYQIDIYWNEEKIGEINGAGLYCKNSLIGNTLAEPFESFKLHMKHVTETAELEETPKAHVLDRLKKIKCETESCNDRQKLKEVFKQLNNIQY